MSRVCVKIPAGAAEEKIAYTYQRCTRTGECLWNDHHAAAAANEHGWVLGQASERANERTSAEVRERPENGQRSERKKRKRDTLWLLVQSCIYSLTCGNPPPPCPLLDLSHPFSRLRC